MDRITDVPCFTAYMSNDTDDPSKKEFRYACLCNMGMICSKCGESPYSFYCKYYDEHEPNTQVKKFSDISQRCLCKTSKSKYNVDELSINTKLQKCMGYKNTCPYAAVYGMNKDRLSNHCLTCLNKYRISKGMTRIVRHGTLVRFRKGYNWYINMQTKSYEKIYTKYIEQLYKNIFIIFCIEQKQIFTKSIKLRIVLFQNDI